jgi:hypothetical protein
MKDGQGFHSVFLNGKTETKKKYFFVAKKRKEKKMEKQVSIVF